jgi:hypothetical protein
MIQARDFLLPRLYSDCLFSIVRQAELGTSGATFGLSFFSFFLRDCCVVGPLPYRYLLESRQGLDQPEIG